MGWIRKRTYQKCIIATLVLFLFCPLNLLLALPVNEGALPEGVTFSNPDSNTLNVTAADKSIIRYTGFDIGAGEKVEFFQPTSSSVVLNKVMGPNASSILGMLKSNGQVFLINRNGIVFGKGAVIDTGSFLASTLDISDSDFLNKKYNFDTGIVTDSSITNHGKILVSAGGFLALLAPKVINTGFIVANQGKIVLASAEKITVDFDGDGLINFALDGELAVSLVENSGKISTQGGEILLAARGAADVLDSLIDNTGIIEATALVEKGGVVRLVNQGGAVISTGALKAKELQEQGASFKIGGTFDVDKSSISNDDGAVTLGTGNYSGEISDLANIIVDTDAILTLTDTTIFRADSDLDGTGYFTMNAGSSIIAQHNNLALYSGEASTLTTLTDVNTFNIYATSKTVEYTMNNNLTVANFYLNKGTFISDPNNYTFSVTNDFSIDNSNGIFKRFTGGDGTANQPYEIMDVYGLQAMECDLSASYVLENDINASSTSNWNAGAGFDQIGWSSNFNQNFTGSLDGKRYTIDSLFINRPTENYVGLFGYTGRAGVGSTIEDLGLTNVNITGYDWVAGLSGSNNQSSIIDGCYVTGTISGHGSVGGLVGESDQYSEITDSYVIGDVTGTDYYIGGLAGDNDTSLISDSYFSGNVTGGVFVGGLVGIARVSTIDKCHAEGTMIGNVVGGLVGVNFLQAVISNSYTSSVMVQGPEFVGGLVGLDYSEIAGIDLGNRIEDCYALSPNITGDSYVGGLVGALVGSLVTGSDVTGVGIVTGGEYVGGFSGAAVAADISKGESVISVIGSRDVGGFIGYAEATTIQRSTAEGLVQGAENVGGFIGEDAAGNVYIKNLWYSDIAGLPANQDTGTTGDVEGIEDKDAKKTKTK